MENGVLQDRQRSLSSLGHGTNITGSHLVGWCGYCAEKLTGRLMPASKR